MKQNCIPKGKQSLKLSDFLDFYLFIQMHITLFLIVQMEQHAFLKICILQKISTIYMESSFDLKDDMEWKAHRLSPIVQVYAI